MMWLALGMALVLGGAPSAFGNSHPSGLGRDQYAGSRRRPDEATAERPRRSPQQLVQLPYQYRMTVWQPPVYQLSRPYIIPIFGVPGRVPVFYPPQPLLLNPGAPPDNPPVGYLPPHRPPSTPGPAYLPPTTPPTLPNRFDDFEDRPIWDTVDEQKGGPSRSPVGAANQFEDVVPTRRPPRPGAATTHPPLIHGNVDRVDSAAGDVAQGFVAPRTTTTPRPPITQNPTDCVWAIISCCSSGDTISHECFEQRGCKGPFWDRSPCESDFAKAAISSALKYYQTK